MKKNIALALLLITLLLASGCSVHFGVNPLPDQSKFIGTEKAQAIALEQAGLSHNDVLFDRVQLEEDDGIWHYDVEFRNGTTEYDAEIKAEDGSILSFEVDKH